ncbi:MAG: sigma 54-interacting transcriptional regulator [Tissierellia bacterium]|nr:sigma 54-interacting transcriptional regulator [Tissierellia bacterium]
MKEANLNQIILQNILQYTDIGIHVIDKARKTIIYNEAMGTLEGLAMHQVVGKDLLDTFPSLNENTSTLIRVLSIKKPILDKVQIYINFKGQKITSLNSTIPLIWKDQIVGALEIAKDITYLNRLSNKLMDLQQELKNNNYNVSKGEIKHYTFNDIIGISKNIKEAIKVAMRAKDSPSSVLIYGETGTGKELFAQSIHYEGIRRKGPFIAQNCAAIPETLLEGILFGTEKGGFTGAVQREGIFEQANGGTLLLDEINSMSYGLQAKLLRVLQEGYVRRIGGVQDIPIDVRIIATTNEEPLESIKNGNLRKDLYYRLNVVYIRIPPLRERKEDIPILSNYFIEKYNPLLGKNILGIEEEVLDCFYKYSWGGNVRELENTIESAMNYAINNRTYLTKEDFISFEHIIKDSNILKSNVVEIDKPLSDYLDEIEKQIIETSLKIHNYNITQTAKKLGMRRQTLQYKMKKYILGAK